MQILETQYIFKKNGNKNLVLIYSQVLQEKGDWEVHYIFWSSYMSFGKMI